MTFILQNDTAVVNVLLEIDRDWGYNLERSSELTTNFTSSAIPVNIKYLLPFNIKYLLYNPPGTVKSSR